ncbi:glycosyltransferase family 2 protein [Candidatus Avelusimicrobium facis]|uniref:glycosyltransferase family 2 protein n=1 Tax=Candidatus Avelusimicrobium facis TaxID=3416203 RepID=UPI003D0B5F2A
MIPFKLTIIMSNYNQARYLDRAIGSVLAQKTNFPWQLIISDDHSTQDDSVDIIKKYAAQYPDKIVALLNTENGRYLKNVLRAKEQTKTPYFTLLDADDYWTDENYLQDAVDYLDAHPDHVIYGRNVLCVKEDGTSYPFISLKTPEKDYDLNDYLAGDIAITQTTGSFFRNVIFSQGIPHIMTQAIGTFSERSFEGDADRFIMHLKYGKAHYVNKFSGVYTILSGGIWSRMSDMEKHFVQAQCFIDYDRYFEHQYTPFFATRAYRELCKGLRNIRNPQEKWSLSEQAAVLLPQLLTYCELNKKQISAPACKKLKYKWMLAVYRYLYKKLSKKGCLDD